MDISNSSQAAQYQNFGAMKKNQFKGLDLFCVNTFKAPIEKFNSNMDLQNWANKQLNGDSFKPSLSGKTERTTIERTSVYNDWKNFLSQAQYITSAIGLIVATSLFSKLSPKTDDVPPPINEDVFKKTLKQVENSQSFNFNKVYTENLKKDLLNAEDSIPDGWIVIPSKDKDPQNYEKNVEKLKMLSANTWCTKSSKANELELGDFHIYYEGGKPKVGIRFWGNEVFEIAGTENNGSVPIEYYNQISSYIKNNNFNMSERAEDSLISAKIHLRNIALAKEKLADDIKNKNYENILNHYGIHMTTNEDGTKTLNKYNDYDGYHNLGIDVYDMLKDVKCIEGDADFHGSPNMNLDKLEYIGGYASFRDSRIKNLNNLKELGSSADFRGSSITNLDSLKKCQKINLTATSVESLPSLEVLDGELVASENISTPKLK